MHNKGIAVNLEEPAVISIKRYLSEYSNLPLAKGYPRILRLVLEGLAAGPVEGDPGDLAHLKVTLVKLGESIGDDCGLAEAFVIVESGLQALTSYNERTAAFLQQPRLELQNMIGMLTETIAAVASGCDTSIRRLQNVEQQIEKAQHIGDVQLLKGRLVECLGQLREETAQQQRVRETAGRIQAGIESSRQRIVAGRPELDPVTGLPTGASVAAAFRACLKEDRRYYVAVFVVQRIHSINVRFGYELGDRVLNAFRDHLEQSAAREDRLFRWRGPTIVALMDRPQPEERTRSEIRRIAEASVSRTFEVSRHEVMIAIAANWTVVPVVESELEITSRIDAFVTSQLPALAGDLNPGSPKGGLKASA